MSHRVGIDIGGTFTDIVLLDTGGGVFTVKVWTSASCRASSASSASPRTLQTIRIIRNSIGAIN